MKKLLLCLLCLSVVGCVKNEPVSAPVVAEPEPTPKEIADKIDTDLIAENSVASVLNFYDKVYGMQFTKISAICARCVYCGYDIKVFDEMVRNSVDVPDGSFSCLRALYCDYTPDFESANYTDHSDDCVLVRRATKPSKINYFNYKKYIPNNAGIKNDDDFISLYKMYSALRMYSRDTIDMNLLKKYTMRNCVKRAELTSTEMEKCGAEEEKFLTDMAAGRAQKCSKKYPNQWNAWKKYYVNTGANQLMQFGAVNLCVPDNISKLDFLF